MQHLHSAAFYVLHSPQETERNKHIEIRVHYVKALFSKSLVLLKHISSVIPLKDLLTKSASDQTLKRLLTLLKTWQEPFFMNKITRHYTLHWFFLIFFCSSRWLFDNTCIHVDNRTFCLSFSFLSRFLRRMGFNGSLYKASLYEENKHSLRWFIQSLYGLLRCFLF